MFRDMTMGPRLAQGAALLTGAPQSQPQSPPNHSIPGRQHNEAERVWGQSSKPLANFMTWVSCSNSLSFSFLNSRMESLAIIQVFLRIR